MTKQKRKRDFNIGIDLGKKGAIYVLPEKPFENSIKPLITPLIGNKVIDIQKMYEFLKPYEGTDCHVVFEKLGIIFGSSKRTAFEMGYQSGMIEAFCTSLKLPFTKVPPKTWQKTMFTGVDPIKKQSKSLDTKAMALVVAKRLFPDVNLLASSRCTTPHDGLVDALLLAEYCKRNI